MDDRGYDDACAGCALRELQRWVAVRAAYYLTIRLEPAGLREAVIEDVAAGWRRELEGGGQSERFDDFFYDYCLTVERRLGQLSVDFVDHEREYRRVWAEHARSLNPGRATASAV